MDWLEITVNTLSGTAEDVASALTSGGFSDLVIEDQEEFQDFLEQNRAYWDYIDETLEQKLQGLSHIKLYLESKDEKGLERLQTLLQTLRQKNPQWGDLSVKIEAMAPVDWEESWKDNYPPQQVGEKLVVLPYWLADSYADDRLPVILDPGLTFGTGAHPSTQMVMAFMEKMDLTGCDCLDLGSGSGILSIAALRLGANHATGVDIDPKAEDIARENAAYNGFGEEQFTALTGNVTADRRLMENLQKRQYRLVLVNIVADVIIALAPVLPQFLGKDSILLCSGILDTRLSDVRAALEGAGLEILQVAEKEDWRSIRAKRR